MHPASTTIVQGFADSLMNLRCDCHVHGVYMAGCPMYRVHKDHMTL